ncbi:MAG TPA: carboxypeptidase regulatory-like domain-containing protein, partial [Thermoanaerobaculia bacterium]
MLDPSARYELKIDNDTVSSAIVLVNGVEVFGTKDFNQTVKTLTKDVTLTAANQLSVELRGAPGEKMTVTVIGHDDVPPMIRTTVAPLPNAAGWNNADVTVTFHCADSTSGIAFCPAPVVVTGEGAGQAITGTARDRAGNATTARATISLDKSNPEIAVTSPADGSTIAAPQVTITGTATDALSGVAAVSCNGIAAATEEGTFTCTVDLVEAANTIAITATDRAGHTATHSLTLNNISTPRVAVTAPANLSFLNISPVTVRGTVTDPNATVRINGVAATVSGNTFVATVPLVEGNNTLSAVAKSASGKIGTGNVQVTLDTTPPRIAISSPADRFETTEATIAITGMVNDVVVGTVNDEQATVTVGGVAADVTNRTFVVPDVPLQLGENSIPVVARDRVGNSITARVTVIRLAQTQAVIRATGGNNQTGLIGRPLDQPLTVTLTDVAGTPIANKAVVFKVTSGNGQLKTATGFAPWVAIYTDANGRAAADYALGTRAGAGNNQVEATATGFAGTAIFVASATPHVAAQVNVDAGQGQSGAINEALAFPFVVVVTDAGHNRLSGVPVTFNIVEGDGKLENGQTTRTAVTDSDGRALTILTLGEVAGFDNNIVHATVAGLTAHPATFTATAKEPGNEADTRITGVVLDNSNQPLAGATLRLYQAYLGSASNIPQVVATPVVTDEQGQFVMTGVPVGAYKLVADGTTIPGANRYPTLEFDIVTIAGQENTVGLPIYLPALDNVNRLCVSETLGGTLTLPSVPGFSFTVAPGAATFPGGARTGCITVTPVHGDKVPMVPGFGQQPRFVITVQPVGTHFNPPAQVSFPNVDGLQPREVTEMYSYD